MFKHIKSLVVICLGMSPAWAGQNQPARYFENNGGLMDRVSPLAVPPKNASAIQDVTLDTRGQLLKRNGQSRLNASHGLGSGAVVGQAYHTSSTGSNFFALVVGTDVYTTGNTYAGTYTKVTGSLSLTNSSSNLAQATSLQDKVVFCNESDKPFTVSSSGNAVAISTSTFDKAKTCGTYGSYLVVGNTTESGTSYPSRIRWSDVNNTESFPPNNYIDIEPDSGDPIVAVVSFDDSVYVFKRHSIYGMLITGLDGADAFILRPITRNIGAWAKESVKVVPGQGVFFLAQNTVYALTSTQQDQFSGSGLNPIGDPIQRTFDSITRSMWANATAEVYPKRYQYWLEVSTTSDSQNHLALVYDYIQKAWTTYNITANSLAQAEDSNGNNILLTGDYAGNHYKQDTTNTTDNIAGTTTNITFSYTTPDLIQDTPELTKNYKYLYIFFNEVESTTTVEASFDYQSNFDFSQQVSLGQIGALYDVAIYDSATYPSINYKVARIELNRSAKAVKLRFTESSANSFGVIGYALVYSMEDWKE